MTRAGLDGHTALHDTFEREGVFLEEVAVFGYDQNQRTTGRRRRMRS